MAEQESTFPIIDWQSHEQLVSDSSELTNELLSMLATELPLTQQALNQAFREPDTHKIGDLLHKLHGSCVYCHLTRLEATVNKTSQRIKQTNVADQDSADELNQEIINVMTELKNKGFC